MSYSKKLLGGRVGIMAVILLLASSFSLFAQTKVTVSGTVYDESNLPMIGVGVVLKGTTNGVATDIDGKYSLSVPAGATIVFSSVGYLDQEMTAPNKNQTIDIFLVPDTQMIEETVVVGYGVQRKSDLTGSISKVKEEDFTNRTITDAAQALQGKTAGVYLSMSSGGPGSESTVRVRGVGTNGDSRPLYVIDGSISMTGISYLNPEDIESMEILKDGASTAIYGARAGNGVILVTTKKGQGNGRINYQFQTSIQSFKKFPEVMNAQQFYEYYTEQGSIGQSLFDTYWDGKTSTNWAEAVIEPSVMMRHNLTFQKGDKDSSIFVSGSYMTNDGAIKGDRDTFKRLNVSINGQWKFKPWLQLTTNNQVSISKRRQVANSSMLAVIRMDPLTPVTYTYDELPADLKNVVNNTATFGELLSDADGNYYGISHFTAGGTNNPFIGLYASDSFTTSYMLNGTTALNITPIKGLTFTSRLGYRFNLSNPQTTSYDVYRQSNSYTNYASVTASLNLSTYYQWENFVNYNVKLGKHNLSAMAGMSFSEDCDYYISGSVSGGQDSTFGFLEDNPNFLYWAYRTGNAIHTVDGAEPIYGRNLSYYARLNWNYADRYIVQASIRADAADSSVLPIENRWGYFPAISAGWTMSNEAFWSNIKQYVPYLKLRASWGANGSTASLGNYSWSSSMINSGFYPSRTGNENTDYEYIPTYIPAYTGNNKLKWETSKQLDLGVDMRFLKDRLTIGLDWYQKKTTDLIISGARPSMAVGNLFSPINAGAISNSGFEFEFGWSDRIGEFDYSIRANGATLKNMVDYVDPSVNTIDGISVHPYGAITRFQAGHPAWYFYGLKFKEIDKTNGQAVFYDLDGDGNIGDGDLTDIGSGLPKLTAGLTINLAYKGFDLLVFASGAFGQKTYMFYDHSDYTYNKLTMFTDNRWTPSNTNGTVPAANAPTQNYRDWLRSDANVVRSDYVKIKQMQLGYTLPRKAVEKIKFQAIRAYVSLDDFFTFTSYKGYDPEVVGSGNGQGVDQGTYPMMKKVVFGVNVTF